MIGSGMPRSHSNSPRPMTSSCVASLGLRNNGNAGQKFHCRIDLDFSRRSEFAPVAAAIGAGCNSRPGRYIALASVIRRGGRVAEGARLESVYTGNRIVGSNPTPSARLSSDLVLPPRGHSERSTRFRVCHTPTSGLRSIVGSPNCSLSARLSLKLCTWVQSYGFS
jgi:hypothetical protein